MANEVERRYGAKGLHGLSVSPGIIRSGAQRYDDPVELEKRLPELRTELKTTAQGAATTVVSNLFSFPSPTSTPHYHSPF